jgi:hypothetical protein
MTQAIATAAPQDNPPISGAAMVSRVCVSALTWTGTGAQRGKRKRTDVAQGGVQVDGGKSTSRAGPCVFPPCVTPKVTYFSEIPFSKKGEQPSTSLWQPGRRIRSVLLGGYRRHAVPTAGRSEEGQRKGLPVGIWPTVWCGSKVFPSRLEGKADDSRPASMPKGKRSRSSCEYVTLNWIGCHRWGASERWRVGGGLCFIQLPLALPRHTMWAVGPDTSTFHPRLPRSRLASGMCILGCIPPPAT